MILYVQKVSNEYIYICFPQKIEKENIWFSKLYFHWKPNFPQSKLQHKYGCDISTLNLLAISFQLLGTLFESISVDLG